MDHVKKMLEEATNNSNEIAVLRLALKMSAISILQSNPHGTEKYMCALARLVRCEERIRALDPEAEPTISKKELSELMVTLDRVVKHIEGHMAQLREVLTKDTLTP